MSPVTTPSLWNHFSTLPLDATLELWTMTTYAKLGHDQPRSLLPIGLVPNAMNGQCVMVVVEFHSLLMDKALRPNAPNLFKFACLSYEEKLAFRQELFSQWQSHPGPAFRYFLRENNELNQWAECHAYAPGQFAYIKREPYERVYLRFSPFCE